MSISQSYYRLHLKTPDWQWLLACLEEQLDGISFRDARFKPVYDLYIRAKAAKPCSAVAKRVNFSPEEKETVCYLLQSKFNGLDPATAEFANAFKIFLKLQEAKPYGFPTIPKPSLTHD